MARILFIAIGYYGYTDRIAEEMRAQGHRVDARLIEDPGFWSKTAKRFAPAVYRRRLEAYHAGLIRESGGTRYDQVVFLQAHQMSDANLSALRTTQPQARFVLYNWDSLTTHDYAPVLGHFDKAATFDPADAATLGIDYLPLFALPEYFAVAAAPTTPDYDLYFVGSMHSTARYEAVRRLADHCAATGLRLKLYLHCSPPRAIRLLREGKWMQGMTLRSIGTDGILAMMRRSRAVFDFANHRQSGYTMRFVENLCAGRKIVATNPRLADEPFFTPDRFMLTPDLDFSGLAAFLDAPAPSPGDFQRFSLATWVGRLLG
ncbi:MAG: hypothetical protein V4537_16405 [Pseudomonadota bacterium]